MTTIFPPTRAEPIFEEIAGFDVSQFKLTVRWNNYLEGLGVGVNQATETGDIESEIQGVQTEVQQVQSFTSVLSDRIDEIDSVAFRVNQNSALIDKLNAVIECQELVGLEIGKLNAELSKTNARINDIASLVENV